jgi:co-chaperonin GroES (HSP10)
VKPSELEIQKGLIVVLDSTVAEAHMLQMMVEVVEVGPYCWPEEPEPRAKAGDVVMVAKMSGNLVRGPKDGKQYRAINDRDIFMGVAQGED